MHHQNIWDQYINTEKRFKDLDRLNFFKLDGLVLGWR